MSYELQASQRPTFSPSQRLTLSPSISSPNPQQTTHYQRRRSRFHPSPMSYELFLLTPCAVSLTPVFYLFPTSQLPSFPTSQLPSFPASLLPCFPASQLPCFPASLLPCFPAPHLLTFPTSHPLTFYQFLQLNQLNQLKVFL